MVTAAEFLIWHLMVVYSFLYDIKAQHDISHGVCIRAVGLIFTVQLLCFVSYENTFQISQDCYQMLPMLQSVWLGQPHSTSAALR